MKETANKVGEVAKNVVTLGGYDALKESMSDYNAQLEKHRDSVRTFETANSGFQRAIESLGDETTACMALLRASQDFVERLSYSRLSSSLTSLPSFSTPDISNVTATLSGFDTAITAGKGVGLGLAASTGAWVLVAHLGTASTGAAIGSLAGAAAHSAILAWFGGGALAAGGGGMLIGSFSISAIALLPMVVFSAYKSYKEVARITDERNKVRHSFVSNFQNADKLLRLKDSTETLRVEMCTKRGIFSARFEQLRLEALGLAERTAVVANEFAESLAVTPQGTVPMITKQLTE